MFQMHSTLSYRVARVYYVLPHVEATEAEGAVQGGSTVKPHFNCTPFWRTTGR